MHWVVEISKAWSILDEEIPKVSWIVGIYTNWRVFYLIMNELFEDFKEPNEVQYKNYYTLITSIFE